MVPRRHAAAPHAPPDRSRSAAWHRRSPPRTTDDAQRPYRQLPEEFVAPLKERNEAVRAWFRGDMQQHHTPIRTDPDRLPVAEARHRDRQLLRIVLGGHEPLDVRVCEERVKRGK